MLSHSLTDGRAISWHISTKTPFKRVSQIVALQVKKGVLSWVCVR